MDQLKALRESIVAAVKATELTETEAWQDLSALSSNTYVDTIETFDDEVRIDGDRFEGPLTWHVTLHYGQVASEDELIISDSFPGSFQGRLEEGVPVIERMLAEVSSFFK
ncbi:hypothetical protein [Methylosinus sp. LW3]|jgi:hypothetical protein|uniref:pPIWI-associating nuclease domain-containing protein n=1 Tax=Methylosinus sp. LW3 TaxID=107635 RepID=UPI0004653DF8|nr:hypothetical protein [Methylosinus sp. LW3]